MERGILKTLPEVLWQHEIDSVRLLVEFTEPGFLTISVSHHHHPISDPQFLHFMDLFFSQDAADPKAKEAKCLYYCLMINPSGKGKAD